MSLLWKLAEPGSFRDTDVTPAARAAAYLVGALRLAAAIAFAATGILLAMRRRAWRVAGLVSVAISAPVLALSPARDAAGLVVDGLILLAVVASWLVTPKMAGPARARSRPPGQAVTWVFFRRGSGRRPPIQDALLPGVTCRGG